MKQEGIRDFLNLPGIVGVALMDGQSQPFFADIDRAFNLQQKEALSQGVLQVIETIPEGFESFEFQFSAYQVYIYKLVFGRVLLVLARQTLDYSDYLQKIEFVQEAIRADFEGAIATLRTLTVSQHPSKPIEKPQPQSSSATLQDVLAALNHLSRFTAQYLGIPVIVNYLKSTRPDQEWLQQFQIDRAAHISFSSTESDMTQPLSDEQQQWIRDWMAAFIRRCSQAVRDFATIVEQKALNPQQKALLLP
ncbi:MAG: hypothetical protein LH702_02295 [Phormidesmis sp. CAN_BIN44]|nr:hypothetical protein [Phormidesmis sp. CAN_BIN44]